MRLAAKWRGVRDRIWNYEIPLIFAHVIMMKTPGACQAKDIRARISWWMDLWEACHHYYLVRDTESEGASREGTVAPKQVDEKGGTKPFHTTFFLVNM